MKANDDVREVFRRNLNYFLELNDFNQVDLAKEIGVSTPTASDWCTGKKIPRMNRIEEISTWLGINLSDLLEDKSDKQSDHYYHDIETRDIADAISKDSELKLLFSAARNASSEDLKTVHEMLKALKRKEQRDG